MKPERRERERRKKREKKKREEVERERERERERDRQTRVAGAWSLRGRFCRRSRDVPSNGILHPCIRYNYSCPEYRSVPLLCTIAIAIAIAQHSSILSC